MKADILSSLTLTQLRYMVAVADKRSFVAAAEACFVTQPTLSMQLHKLEEELEVRLFDRSRQPVVATEAGELIIDQARRVIMEAEKIGQLIRESKGQVSGQLKLGVIPTIAPYLLPLFISNFLEQYPLVRLEVIELTTAELMDRLRKGKLDAAILATPLEDQSLHEQPLFYESFAAYVSKKHTLAQKKQLLPADIHLEDVWILNEGHCFRNQVLNLCKTKAAKEESRLNYESGSIETLKRMVEQGNGITILPELALAGFNAKQTSLIRYFKDPEPVREISLVTHRAQLKNKLMEVLSDAIVNAVPEKMRVKGRKKIIAI